MIDDGRLLCEIRKAGACPSSASYLVRFPGGLEVRACDDHAEQAFGAAAEIVPLDPPPCCPTALVGDVLLCEVCGRALCDRHAERDDRSFVCSTCLAAPRAAAAPVIGWRTPRSVEWIPCVHRERGVVVRHRAVDPCPLCLLEQDRRGELALEQHRRHVSVLTIDRPIEGFGVCVRPHPHSSAPSGLDRSGATGEGGSITTGAAGDPRLRLSRILAKIGGHICAHARAARGEVCQACRTRRARGRIPLCDPCADRTIADAGHDHVDDQGARG